MLGIEEPKLPNVVTKSVIAIKMGDPQAVVAGCLSEANVATAASFLLTASDRPDRPRTSINEPSDDQMDGSTDVVSLFSENSVDKTPDDSKTADAKRNFLSRVLNRRLRRQKREMERLEMEKLETERLEMERLEMERLETERLEQERAEKERLETERRDEARRMSVGVAEEFLDKFIRQKWETHLDNGNIKIHSPLTMDEVMDIGRLDQFDGPRECRKLFTAPVIHDAIGLALWMELFEQVAAKEGGDKKREEAMSIDKLPEIKVTRVPSETAAKKTEKRKRGEPITRYEGQIQRRRARSARRATEGHVISAVRSCSASAVPTSERNRWKSDRPLVSPDQVMCTTCGSRAMGSKADDGEAMETDGDESADERGGDADEEERSRSRQISTKMGKKLTALGGGVARGYGGSRLIA